MGTVQIDGSTPKITVGNATAEDATILFDGNAQDFYIALDDSADDLVIGLGSTVGTTPAISINEDQDVTISDGAIDFDVASHDGTNGLKLGGTLVTTTAAEMNLIDGGTARGTTALADGDGILINDGGTMRMTNVTTVKTYMGGDNTPAFFAYLDSLQTSVADDTDTKVELATETYDTDNAFDSTTNYRFTVPAGAAGKYHIYGGVWCYAVGGASENSAKLFVNGSQAGVYVSAGDDHSANTNITQSFAVDLDLSESDYVELYGKMVGGSSRGFYGLSGDWWTYMGGHKIIGA